MRVRWTRVAGLLLWAGLLAWTLTPWFPAWPTSLAPLMLAFTAAGLLTVDDRRP